MKKSILVSTLLLSATLTFALDIGGIAKGVVDNVSKDSNISNQLTNLSTSSTKSNLDNATVSGGLKEALKGGVNFAVKQLGSNNGYLNTSAAKIPLPDNLARAESLIRKAGGDKMADDLINSMNNAATKAAPQTTQIFMDAIDKMTLADAQKILSGGNDAATKYFKANTTDSLKKSINPIIQQSMKENQVASYYDSVNNIYKSTAGNLTGNNNVTAIAKNFGVDSYIPGNSNESLDEFVTSKAIDGLFAMIAQKEAAIRTNPTEQTSSLLKQVFGK